MAVGSAYAVIHDGLKAGVLSGDGVSVKGSLLHRQIKSGKVAVQPLACQGTQGAWHTNNTANIDTPGLSLTGLSARARGRQHDVFNAYGQTQGRVGKVNIGNGEIVVRGVIASARVTKPEASSAVPPRTPPSLRCPCAGTNDVSQCVAPPSPSLASPKSPEKPSTNSATASTSPPSRSSY